jgi:hypothetical protein
LSAHDCRRDPREGAEVIFAFDHPHKPGDICSRAACEYARRKPSLVGGEVFDDIPMVIVGERTPEEYLNQPIPDDWTIPPLVYGCNYIYEIQTD